MELNHAGAVLVQLVGVLDPDAENNGGGHGNAARPIGDKAVSASPEPAEIKSRRFINLASTNLD